MLNLAQGFLGVDPLASQYQAWSSYNYVLGNPTDKIDPDGKASQDCCNGDPPITEAEIFTKVGQDIQGFAAKVFGALDVFYHEVKTTISTALGISSPITKTDGFSAAQSLEVTTTTTTRFNFEAAIMDARPLEDGTLYSPTPSIISETKNDAKTVFTAEAKTRKRGLDLALKGKIDASLTNGGNGSGRLTLTAGRSAGNLNAGAFGTVGHSTNSGVTSVGLGIQAQATEQTGNTKLTTRFRLGININLNEGKDK